MQAILQFNENISRVRALGALHYSISGMTTSAIDSSDMLRAQLVLCVSALDHYVHEVTVEGMLEVFSGNRNATDALSRFPLQSNILLNSSGNSINISHVEQAIREKHSFLSFQQPDKVADAIRLICSCKLWDELSNRMGRPVRDLKNELALIVDRRNKIAHEADLDPSYPGQRWSITSSDVNGVIDFIERLCSNIDDIVDINYQCTT